MAKYGTFQYGEEVYGSGTGGGPASILDERVPWIFQAIDSEDLYEFAINPLDASIPSIQKTITEQRTADGTPVLFQGRDKVGTLSFSGTILTEAHYTAMKTWYAVKKQVLIKDDLGRNYWVFLKEFSPTRKYVPEFPWRHEFSCQSSVLNWS